MSTSASSGRNPQKRGAAKTSNAGRTSKGSGAGKGGRGDRDNGDKQGTSEGGTASRAASLFDLRLLIGALFVVYGVILTIVGIADPHRHGKNPGNATININLWTGLGMLVTGLLFLLWWRIRPLVAEPNPTGRSANEK